MKLSAVIREYSIQSRYRELLDRLDGARFYGASVDVDCLAELAAACYEIGHSDGSGGYAAKYRPLTPEEADDDQQVDS